MRREKEIEKRVTKTRATRIGRSSMNIETRTLFYMGRKSDETATKWQRAAQSMINKPLGPIAVCMLGSVYRVLI